MDNPPGPVPRCLGEFWAWSFGCLLVVPFVPFVASVPSPPAKRRSGFLTASMRRRPPLHQRRSVFPTASTRRRPPLFSRSGKDSASPLPRAPLPKRPTPRYASGARSLLVVHELTRIFTNANGIRAIREDLWTPPPGPVPTPFVPTPFPCHWRPVPHILSQNENSMRNSFSPPTPPIPSKIRANPRNPWSSSEGCSPRRLSPPTTCCPRIDTNIHEYERNSCAFVNGRGRSQAVLREVVHEVLQQPRVVGAVDAARLEENHVGRNVTFP